MQPYANEDGSRLANNSDVTNTVTWKVIPGADGKVDIALPTYKREREKKPITKMIHAHQQSL